MQSHQVLWNVSLSSGENFRECSGQFTEVEGEPSPWQRLVDYLDETGAEITSLWLSSPNGQRHHLPSRGGRSNPFLHAFHHAEKPAKLWFRRRQGADPSHAESPVDHYTIAEAIYPTYKVQVFVSEQDPNLSWVLVTDG